MKTNNSKGFTLLEAMIVVALLGILAAIAYPSYQNTIARNRAKAASSEITKALAYARSEAMSRNRAVAVCPRSTPYSDECGGANDWSNGFFVFVDRNLDRTYSNIDGDILLHYYLKGPVQITIENKAGFIWQPGGIKLRDSNNGLPNSTIEIVPSEDGSTHTKQKRTCTIAKNGRILC